MYLLLNSFQELTMCILFSLFFVVCMYYMLVCVYMCACMHVKVTNWWWMLSSNVIHIVILDILSLNLLPDDSSKLFHQQAPGIFPFLPQCLFADTCYYAYLCMWVNQRSELRSCSVIFWLYSDTPRLPIKICFE